MIDAGAVHVYRTSRRSAATGNVPRLRRHRRILTALRQAETALRASEGMFAGVQTGLDYITISDLDTGRIIDVNKEPSCGTTGWSRDEAIGRTSERARHLAEAKAAGGIPCSGYGFLPEYPMQLGIRSGATTDCARQMPR